MMKYMLTVSELFEQKKYNIIITEDDVTFSSFPTELENPNYDNFLEQVSLTDEKVHKLQPDAWYDFPEVSQ